MSTARSADARGAGEHIHRTQEIRRGQGFAGGFQRLRFKGKRLFARFPDGLVAGIHIKSYP